MAQELNWTTTRKREELRRGVQFLESMGLRGVPDNPLTTTPVWVDWVWNKLVGSPTSPPFIATKYSRAQFEAGELDQIRAAFLARATSIPTGEQGRSVGEEKKLQQSQLQQTLSDIPGYEETKSQHLENVLVEIGCDGGDDIALDELLEVSISLRLYYMP